MHHGMDRYQCMHCYMLQELESRGQTGMPASIGNTLYIDDGSFVRIGK